MKADLKKFFFKNIGLLLIAAVSALYIVKGLYSLEESGRTVLQIIGDGILSATVGTLICMLMRQTGISYGNDDTEIIKARSFHARLIDKASCRAELLDSFCEKESLEAIRSLRQRILSSGGLKYSDYFDEEGIPTGAPLKINDSDEKIARRKKKRALCKALKLKITPLTPASLSVDGSKEKDPFDFGRTEGQYLIKRGGTDIISKIAFGLIFGYYAIRLTEGAGLDDVLWAALQIGIYLILGAAQMIQAYMFVRSEIYGRIIRKTDLLQKFFRYANISDGAVA